MIVGKSTSVEFKSGMMLSKEMLKQLEYQTHLNELRYRDYPDGIIYGLDLFEDNGRLFFSPGLVKLTGDCFYIHSAIDVYRLLDDADSNWDKGTVHSAIILEANAPDYINEGVCVKELQVKLVAQSAAGDDMLRLAEFQYYKGKRDWDIKNTELGSQLNTTGTVFSLLNVRYSLNGESVFSPYICDLMRKYLAKAGTSCVEDTVLLFMLSQNQLISSGTLRQWFACKKIEADFQSRSDIIEKFMEGVSAEKVISHPETPRPRKPIADNGFGL